MSVVHVYNSIVRHSEVMTAAKFVWPCHGAHNLIGLRELSGEDGSLSLYQFIRVLAWVATWMLPARPFRAAHTHSASSATVPAHPCYRRLVAERCGSYLHHMPVARQGSADAQVTATLLEVRIRLGRLQFKQQKSEGTWRGSKTGETKAT